MNTVWFTSDIHFGHKNVITHANRPFNDVEEMDEAIIAKWNARVSHGDHVYIVGDFSFRKPAETEVIIGRLKGSKHLIRGNHDKHLKANTLAMFASVHDLHCVKVIDPDDGHTQRIVLCHYAMRVWDQAHYGAWHLYGHSHGTMADWPNSLSFDVGVDCHGYEPINYHEVKSIMAKKDYRPVDHHNPRTKR